MPETYFRCLKGDVFAIQDGSKPEICPTCGARVEKQLQKRRVRD